jgi:hypothetical protein
MRKIYIQINGELIEKSISHDEPSSAMVMSDIAPYRSMVDGSMIEGRRQHRDHLRQHNCIEVGNEKMESKPAPIVDTRRDVLRAQLANMTHSQANKILDKIREEARFTRRN